MTDDQRTFANYIVGVTALVALALIVIEHAVWGQKVEDLIEGEED